MIRRIGVVIGHGGNDCGAVSSDGKYTELAYNTELANDLIKELESKGYETVKHNRGYNRAENVPWLNSSRLDLIISLHCNSAANKEATGTEVIHYEKSTLGKIFAEILSKNVSKALGLKNRGAKVPFNGRGEYLLKNTKAVCVISEPFFISNDKDLAIGLEKKKDYIKAIIDSIDKYFENNKK